MYSDPEYVKARKKLIPEAWSLAEEEVKNDENYKILPLTQQRTFLDQVFLRKMDSLCKERIHKKGNGNGES